MDFQKLIEKRNKENLFAAYVDIQTCVIREGYAEAVMTVRSHHKNPLGTVHGGALFSLGDVVSGSAAASYGCYAATVSADYHYLRPAVNTARIVAAATEIKRGRSLAVFDVQLTDDDGSCVGRGTFTYFIFEDRSIEL